MIVSKYIYVHLIPELCSPEILLIEMIYYYTAVQSQKAVSAIFTSEHILPFGYAEQDSCVEII